MPKPTYKLTVGSAALDSAKDPDTQIVTIDVQMGTAPFVDFAKITVGCVTKPKDSLPGQAAAAAASAAGAGGTGGASGEINGKTVKTKDDFNIELGYEKNLTRVFTGKLANIEPNTNTTVFEGSNGSTDMTKTRINQTYQNKPAGKIVSDLASQAKAKTGSIDNGIDLPFYAIDDRKHTFQHAVELAAKSGLDLFFTPGNKLEMKPFKKTKGDHTFSYGKDIIEVQILSSMPMAGKIEVVGESPSGSQGKEAWHWLIKDSSAVKGTTGNGNQLLISEPAIRAKKGADTYAAGKLDMLTRSAAHGRIITLGNPGVKPGDAIDIKDVPTKSLNGLFQVRHVKHRFNVQQGFTTTIDFITAAGGAGAPGGLP